MSVIYGAIMFIGGIVMCFTGELRIGVALFAIGAFCICTFDISVCLDRISPRNKTKSIKEMVDGLKTISDMLDKINEKEN